MNVIATARRVSASRRSAPASDSSAPANAPPRPPPRPPPDRSAAGATLESARASVSDSPRAICAESCVAN